MNIVLSCAADRKLGRGAYIIYKGGKKLVSDSFNINKSDDSTLKEYVFESLIRGLRSVRNTVKHEDLLLIKLPNIHMVEWLNGSKEYKGYNNYLDVISDLIDTIDCKYLFTKDTVKDAKKLCEEVIEVKVLGLEEAFSDME